MKTVLIESPRRGETFVSPEYAEGMGLMLQQEAPEGLVFGTGETHSVHEFVDEAFGYADGRLARLRRP